MQQYTKEVYAFNSCRHIREFLRIFLLMMRYFYMNPNFPTQLSVSFLIPVPHPALLASVSLGRLWSCVLGGDTDATSGSGMTGKSDAGVAIPAALDACAIRCQLVSLTSGLSLLSLCLSLLCEWRSDEKEIESR